MNLSLAGRDVTTRLRTMAFALLGLTAAAGLGLVAIFAQPGWPLRPTGPLPPSPDRPGAVSPVGDSHGGSAAAGFALSPTGPGGVTLPAPSGSPTARSVAPSPAPGLGGAVGVGSEPVALATPSPGSVGFEPGDETAVQVTIAPESPVAAGGAGEVSSTSGSNAGEKPTGSGAGNPPVTAKITPEELAAEAASAPSAEESAPEPAPETSVPSEPGPEPEVPVEEAVPSPEEVVAEEATAEESPAPEEPAAPEEGAVNEEGAPEAPTPEADQA